MRLLFTRLAALLLGAFPILLPAAPVNSAFFPDVRVASAAASTSNATVDISASSGEALWVSNESTTAAEIIYIKVGSSSSTSASSGAVFVLYAGGSGTIPLSKSDTYFGFLSLSGTPTLRYARGQGLVSTVAKKSSSTGGGSGTVTATAGSLTANSPVLGAGGTDTKVVAGITTDGTSKLTLGVAGTSVGSVDLKNATSGTITLSPVSGALGAVTLTVPARTATLGTTTGTLTNGNCAKFDSSGNVVDNGSACATGVSGQTITTTSTISANNRIVLCDATSGAVTVNLGAAATYQNITVKKIDSSANACTVDPNSTETVDGGSTAALTAQYASISLYSDGSNWFIF